MHSTTSTRHAERVVSCVGRQGQPGFDAPGTGPGSLVLQSWDRCLHSYNLDPGGGKIDAVLDGAGLRQRRERLGEMFDIARIEMTNLYQQTAGSGYAVVLTDATGTVLECVGDPTLDKEFKQVGLYPAADWSERCAGTNGMGTSLFEGGPVTIHRDEHFLSCNVAMSCSAAPILDPHGGILAVLDASSVRCHDTRGSQMYTAALVNMSARLIENCEFLRVFRDSWVLRFHVRPEFVGLLTEGMLAIDDRGQIVAINGSALSQLGLEARSQVVGRPVDELFDLPADLIASRNARSDYTVWPVRDLQHGKRYFATLRGPLARQRISARPASGRAGIVRPVRREPRGNTYTLRSLMSGGDPRMAYNVRCAERLVDKNVPILLCGETGTGKEALARAIHAAGGRAEKPFVAVNCASIPESLIESELFGYLPGAFTGARRDGMRGKIRQSSGGTLFLDEIGDMPAELQTRLLRVLEQQEIVPLGSETPVPVELHVISATHQDLPTLVAEGLFREDLYYRLNGVALMLPPLRDRQDREAVIRTVLGEECEEGQEVGIDAAAFRRLMAYRWPGNIRQLRNCIRTTLALCDDGIIRLADLPTEVLRSEHASAPSAEAQAGEAAVAPSEEEPDARVIPMGSTQANPLASAERETLLRELERHRWNITNTAATLGISRNTIYRKMKRHNIAYSQERCHTG